MFSNSVLVMTLTAKAQANDSMGLILRDLHYLVRL